GHLVRREVDGLGEPARKAGIARDEAMHLGWIARDDDDEPVAMIFHIFEQCFDGLAAEIAFPFGRGQAVGLIDEENAIERRSAYVERLHRGLTDIAADELASVGLEQMAFAKHAKRAIDIAERPRHDGFSDARRSGEYHVPAGHGD